MKKSLIVSGVITGITTGVLAMSNYLLSDDILTECEDEEYEI